ncbi:protoporphyrinogen oxidase HemJ [Palleronia caenipelagi]|uniref:Protoporphyrinogen IX oxidase n=1 Tax=Palleronia caenipelagi TaxID=2489174 RepID=A0A547Q8R8_9RHOB|nr:protoporphyrinogen oxidase HemJ [Palleronia caenipelagi]TRD22786.1 protoporphyrinogen oxidase HemJ [Palleronia caenipelagi]
MTDLLASSYVWIKVLHILSFVSWMAGLFYLPRLFVYHVERAKGNPATEDIFQVMERRLLKAIMNPAMISTWLFGLLLIGTGAVNWLSVWPWVKAIAVIAMTWFHMWCATERKKLAAGEYNKSGRAYRMWNEFPTLLLVVIVISVVAKPF